jgi:hypothetical protein
MKKTAKPLISAFVLSTIFFSMLLLNSCKKEEQFGNLEIVFDHEFAGQPFRADTTTFYPLSNGENLRFARFEYYISNIELQLADGTWWAQEESYHIINANRSKPSIKIPKLKEGDIIGLRYMIGVDSIRNFSGAQEGALSPSNGLFWSWNTGYIFVAAEGICQERPVDSNFFIHHIGGFRAPFIGSRTVTFSLADNVIIRGEGTSTLNMKVEVDRFYQGPSTRLSVVQTQTIHNASETSFRVADNIASMFSVKSTVN